MLLNQSNYSKNTLTVKTLTRQSKTKRTGIERKIKKTVDISSDFNEPSLQAVHKKRKIVKKTITSNKKRTFLLFSCVPNEQCL